MKRRTRSLLFLAAIATLLGAAIWLQLRREAARFADPLISIDPASVRLVELDCTGCTPRRYEKRAEGWYLSAPREAPADPGYVEKLIAIARAPVRTRYAPGELDPAKLGLEPPQASLRLDGLLLRFGTTDAIHADRYVAVGGAIALVPDRFSALLFAGERGGDLNPLSPGATQ